jgi:glycosyltransferase involved in cell wall biosynthesis
MSSRASVLVGLYFYPRGGSAHATRAISKQLERNGFDVRLLAGSRGDLGRHADADAFFDGLTLTSVDFTPALSSAEPARFDGGLGTAPMHGSYEDRPGAPDLVMASLDDDAYELQVDAWERELIRAGGPGADILYLSHLTPLNEAAARCAPDVPIVGHIHGSELLMLERIAGGAPGWAHASDWLGRMCRWAAACKRLVVNSPQGLTRAAGLLDVDPDRFLLVPGGFDSVFEPRPVERRAHWRRHLSESPQGWGPGGDVGTVAYAEADLAPLEGTTLVYSGRFTEVKRLPLLIEAFKRAGPRFDGEVALVLVGGYPGEWEGEHPLQTIERVGARGVYLAGWHAHDVLPDFMNAADVLVLPSVLEQFGQVVVEAMACGLPVIAVNRAGPASIIDSGQTGWLVEPDDRDGLADAMVAAVNDPAERRRRGELARAEAAAKYSWERVGTEISAGLDGVVNVSARPAAVNA